VKAALDAAAESVLYEVLPKFDDMYNELLTDADRQSMYNGFGGENEVYANVLLTDCNRNAYNPTTDTPLVPSER